MSEQLLSVYRYVAVPSIIDGKFELVEENGQRTELGKGRFSFVYLGHSIDLIHPINVAVKVMNPFRTDDKDGQSVSARELIPLQHSLQHSGIIQIIHKTATSIMKGGEEFQVWMFVMELCDDTLVTYMTRTRPEQHARLQLTLEMFSAVAYIHSLNILHRDIKPENILIKIDQKGGPILKVADFGLAEKLAESSTKIMQKAGTLPWIAPEAYLDGGYGLPADVYAAAQIALAMMACHTTCTDRPCHFCDHLCLFSGNKCLFFTIDMSMVCL